MEPGIRIRPSVLALLLRIYYEPTPEGEEPTPEEEKILHELETLRLIEPLWGVTPARTTARAAVWIEALLSTPLPVSVQRWEMP